MKMKRLPIGLVALTIFLGLCVLVLALNVSAVPAFEGRGVVVANTPPTDGCEGEWEKTVSYQSWVCIDGFWQNVDFEQWQCKNPIRVVEHDHRSGTQQTCQAG